MKQLESVEALVKAGEGDRLSSLSAQVESSAAELDRLETEIETQQALGALDDAAQHPCKNHNRSVQMADENFEMQGWCIVLRAYGEGWVD